METGTDMPVNELTQGPEQESELLASIEQCLSLAQEILASIDEALSKAQSRGCPNLAVGPPDHPPSPRSPRGEITRQQPFEAEGTEMISKKRKTQPKWTTSRVKLGAGPEAEGPLDDGYSWRKFGQKDIRGAKHPRGYYRCAHRHSQGCLAMKHAQQSDDNPAIFDVTYRGTHTCDQKPSLPAAATSSKWTSTVKLGSGPEAEGPLDDGYSWRKYGQKDIPGAKYPRGYYRCAHRHSQGCLAMKHAQQSDDNPAIFDVTYRGTHTCDQKPSLPAAATSSKWTSTVKLGSGPEAEGPLDDGYSWRKYGQKDIPGAKYPRGYYRCAHRHSQGCLAMKHAQQSDDNPAIFDVTYRGTHTCDQKPSLPAAATSSKWTSTVKLGSGPEAEGPLDDGYSWRKYGQKDIPGAKYPRGYYRCTQRHSQSCLATKQVQQSDDNPAIFNVTYRGTHTCDHKLSPPADATSSFLCSSPPSTPDNSGKRSFTEAFTSSVTSELNCFSSSPGRKSRYGEPSSLQASESFLAMVPALESGNNSSVFDLYFPFDLDSDTEVPF